MIVSHVQRWRDGRASYRPAGEPIDTRKYEVAAIAEDAIAKSFVVTHHYSHGFPSARFRFGLYRGHELVGVLVLSHPVNDAVLAPLPGVGLERTELGRLVLLDDVPANGESFFVARCFELARAEGIVSVISFSDPVPRTNAAGVIIFRGHYGCVYQASNGIYTGRSTPSTLRLLPDGSVFSNRAAGKLRRGERGWEYALRQLQAAGAGEWSGNGAAYVRTWVPRVTRSLRHHGCLRYLFGLDRRARRRLPKGLPYPKLNLSREAA